MASSAPPHSDSPSALSEAFLGACQREPADSDSGPAIEQALDELWDQARAAWPELSVDPVQFMTFVGERVPPTAALLDAIVALRPGDLLLCHACLQGDATALAAFDSGLLALTPSLVRRLRLSDAEVDDVRQKLAQRLLVGTEQGGPRLAAYSGRGDLRNWVRTAALRVAQNLIASRARDVPADDHDALARAVEPHADPTLDLLRRRYGEQFRRAFEDAVGDLTDRERTLLRLAIVDGMTSDGLSTVYGVHRATAARWVASARDRLSARTRRRMMDQLGVGRADLQSIMRLISSQLDVSVRRCLADDPTA